MGVFCFLSVCNEKNLKSTFPCVLKQNKHAKYHSDQKKFSDHSIPIPKLHKSTKLKDFQCNKLYHVQVWKQTEVDIPTEHFYPCKYYTYNKKKLHLPWIHYRLPQCDIYLYIIIINLELYSSNGYKLGQVANFLGTVEFIGLPIGRV